jgi:hypothetical protein
LTAAGGTTELYLGNDYHYVKLVDGGNIELRATTANLFSQASWNFDITGNIDARQVLGIKVPNGVPSVVATINSSSVNWMSNPMSNLATTGGSGSGLRVNVNSLSDAADIISIATPGTGYLNGELITVTSGSSSATFTIVIAGRNSWQFDSNGDLVLPAGGDIKDITGTSVLGDYNGTGTYSSKTVSWTTTGEITDAEEMADAINAAGFTNIEAEVDTQNRVVIRHKQGGDFRVKDVTGAPMADYGFSPYVYEPSDDDFATGTRYFHDVPAGDILHDYVASSWEP